MKDNAKNTRKSEGFLQCCKNLEKSRFVIILFDKKRENFNRKNSFPTNIKIVVILYKTN